jgi:hypothetical protein
MNTDRVYKKMGSTLNSILVSLSSYPYVHSSEELPIVRVLALVI